MQAVLEKTYRLRMWQYIFSTIHKSHACHSFRVAIVLDLPIERLKLWAWSQDRRIGRKLFKRDPKRLAAPSRVKKNCSNLFEAH